MNKMKLLLVSCAAVLLAGCTVRENVEPFEIKYGYDMPLSLKDLRGFESEVTNKSMQVGETSKMEISFYPVLEISPIISYSSSNPNVVSIDQNGNITAKANGFAILTADCGDFSSECYVSVTETTSKSEAKKVFQAITDAQKSSEFVKTNSLSIMEYSHSTVTKDGKLNYESVGYESTIMDKDEAYVYLSDSIYKKKIIQDAPFSYSGGSWIFYCTDEFETYIFHEDSGAKRYMRVDCASYVESGDRFAALCAVLDNVFSVGSDYFTNQFKFVQDAEMSAENVDYVDGKYSNVKNVKYRIDNANGYISYDADYGTKTIRPEDYSQTGLESGVVAKETIHGEQYYKDNYCRYMNTQFRYDYDWRGSTYVDISQLQRRYDIEKKELYYPNIKAEGWGEVEEIFDL